MPVEKANPELTSLLRELSGKDYLGPDFCYSVLKMSMTQGQAILDFQKEHPGKELPLLLRLTKSEVAVCLDALIQSAIDTARKEELCLKAGFAAWEPWLIESICKSLFRKPNTRHWMTWERYDRKTQAIKQKLGKEMRLCPDENLQAELRKKSEQRLKKEMHEWLRANWIRFKRPTTKHRPKYGQRLLVSMRNASTRKLTFWDLHEYAKVQPQLGSVQSRWDAFMKRGGLPAVSVYRNENYEQGTSLTKFSASHFDGGSAAQHQNALPEEHNDEGVMNQIEYADSFAETHLDDDILNAEGKRDDDDGKQDSGAWITFKAMHHSIDSPYIPTTPSTPNLAEYQTLNDPNLSVREKAEKLKVGKDSVSYLLREMKRPLKPEEQAGIAMQCKDPDEVKYRRLSRLIERIQMKSWRDLYAKAKSRRKRTGRSGRAPLPKPEPPASF